MPLKDQKTQERLALIGLLALDSFFLFGAVSNYYRYFALGVNLDIYLGVFSTVLTAILTSFLIGLFLNYLDKKRFIESFKK